MALVDMPLEALEVYTPFVQEPSDFDTFWAETLNEARQHPLDAGFEPVNVGLRTVETYDLTFSGFGGQPIKGWLILPRRRDAALPCVVEYIGYGGGRGFATDWLLWASVGFAHLVMDTRGQGSSWRQGDTPDAVPGTNAQFPGFLTNGILDPHTYYYRRLFTDAVRAVEAARSHPAIDATRIAVAGGSQGGGISLAVAGLDSSVSAAMPDVPFLCHFRRGSEITDKAPYAEIALYCKTHRDKIDTVFNTLSYFDGVNFAARAQATAIFSVALMDDICPPSTIFAAFNRYAGPKELHIYPYNNHEGGQNYQTQQQIRFLNHLWQ